MQQNNSRTTALCACGDVELEAIGEPVVVAVCYCDDCQSGSRLIEALPGAPAVRDADGGTAYVLYRKDRVRWSKGAQSTLGHKIKEGSATNRIVATCCNSAMLLNFDDGKHWVNVYRNRVQGRVPPLLMRLCTKFRNAADPLPNDVPSYSTFPPKFLGKLLAARIAMLFKR